MSARVTVDDLAFAAQCRVQRRRARYAELLRAHGHDDAADDLASPRKDTPMTAPTARRNDHARYLDGSPTYAALYARHGAWMDTRAAARFAIQHGTTLSTLVVDGDLAQPTDDLVRTLDLVRALGY